MFGYVLLNAKSADDEDKKRYALYYCGLCKALEARGGRTATKALSYDMTFLYLLLADLYNQEGEIRKEHCQIHPVSKREYIHTPIASYCADMQILLSYCSAMDKVRDEGSQKAQKFIASMKDIFTRIEREYPRQSAALKENLGLLDEDEKRNERDTDLVSRHFSMLLGEIFCPYDDIWAKDLRNVGQGLGKFIYLLDAWDDKEKDEKRMAYNPFSGMKKDEALRERVREDLTLAAASAAQALERLPLDDNLPLLRNVIYSGIWTKFEGTKTE